jgi:hypothetical protein
MVFLKPAGPASRRYVSIGCAVAIGLTLLPIGTLFGFVIPPLIIFVYVIPVTVVYLALVEVTRVLFYRLEARR